VPEDRWSADAARQQLARLATYRQGEPFEQQPQPGRSYVSDVMLIGIGEPRIRYVTKLGGLPYRPASVPWPRTGAGEPLVFFGQVCFAESRDLFEKLPGDVLLIFTKDEHDHTCGNLHYEWYPLGFEGLVAAEDIPETPWRVAPYFTLLSRREEDESADRWPDWLEEPRIGGRAYSLQDEPEREGTFLACFASLSDYEGPDGDPRLQLDFHDGGLLNLFLASDGQVFDDFSCY
jgi:hypothetical protein